MIYLRGVTRVRKEAAGYPADLPVCTKLEQMEFTSPVTVLSGDNGSGKTTLMELFSCGVGAVRVDGTPGVKGAKIRAFREAAGDFRFLLAPKRPRTALFFQAEDFIRYIDRWSAQKQETQEDLSQVLEEYKDRSVFARQQATSAYQRTLGEISSQYGEDLTARSHGESFLTFFRSRLIPGGLYLLDEPEGALSFEAQLGLLILIREAVELQGQLILATHSPVLSAYPGAQILSLEDGGVRECAYEELSSVTFLTYFLQDRKAFLRRIFS